MASLNALIYSTCAVLAMTVSVSLEYPAVGLEKYPDQPASSALASTRHPGLDSSSSRLICPDLPFRLRRLWSQGHLYHSDPSMTSKSVPTLGRGRCSTPCPDPLPHRSPEHHLGIGGRGWGLRRPSGAPWRMGPRPPPLISTRRHPICALMSDVTVTSRYDGTC